MFLDTVTLVKSQGQQLNNTVTCHRLVLLKTETQISNFRRLEYKELQEVDMLCYTSCYCAPISFLLLAQQYTVHA